MSGQRRKTTKRNTVPLTVAVKPEERDAIYELAAQLDLTNVQLVLASIACFYRHLGSGDALINVLTCRNANLWEHVKAKSREKAVEERSVADLEYDKWKKPDPSETLVKKEDTHSGRPPPARPGRTG